MKDKASKIGLNYSWNPKDGDYVRDKYEYDKSHEEIQKKEQKIHRILHFVYFAITIGVIIGILQIITSF